MVGAKTVNGPAPLKVATKSALITAASKIDNASVLTTTSTKDLSAAAISSNCVKAASGINTLSTTCTTPLLASTSAITTLASASVTS